MSRGLSAAAKAYSGPIFWLAAITSAEGTTYYYWDGPDTRTIGGHSYSPYLRIIGGFRHTRSLQVDAGEIELDNTDLTMESLVLNTATFDGAVCLISQYLFSIDTEVLIMRGRLSDQERRQEGIGYRVVADFEPAAQNGMPNLYSAMCRWRFKGAACGYAGEETECLKDWAACTAYSNTHRFSGYPTVSPDMTRFYGGGPDDDGKIGSIGKDEEPTFIID